MAALAMYAADVTRFTTGRSNAPTSVTIKGTSSLHEWQMQGATISGFLETDPLTWSDEGQKPALVKLSIPVDSIRSDHQRMDRIMREALKADKNPSIDYMMSTASLLRKNADSFVVRTGGKLTIAGVTRDVPLDVTVQKNGEGRYLCIGETPIRMTDFGIKPPVAMMGTLKTGDQVTVVFQWSIERTRS
jgi:polyisoprenoid-binding protein YceI